jgi:hypothetical protein
VSNFYNEFLAENPRDFDFKDGRALLLGAFGKHPGWDDHIEENAQAPDLGLRSATLAWTKSLLYVQGVGRNIDLGAWEKLQSGEALPEFDHLFVWQNENGYVVGAMWSSSDGKGRKRYPMVVAAHALGVSLPWILAVAVPRLDELRRECEQLTTAPQVSAALDRCRRLLNEELAKDGRSQPSPRELLVRFARHPRFAPGHDGLLRVLYRLQTQAGSFAPGEFSARNAGLGVDLRLPAAGNTPYDIFAGWSELLRGFVDPAVPFLLIWPVGGDYVDLIIGEPVPEHFFCLRADATRLPTVSQVPFHLDEAFRTKAEARLDAIIRGEARTTNRSMMPRWFGALFRP